MNDVEKHELFEQQRKIFEAGVQRADKRTGSFSFLTWSFLIAPLIAGEEFLAAMFKSAAAVEEDAKTAQVGAAPQAANDHPLASDLSKTSAEDETAKGPAAPSEAHAAQLNPTGLLAQPHEDAPKPSTARSEAVAAASAGGGDDADSRYHDAHTAIDDSSVNLLSADSHFGSSPFPGGSTLESVQSIVLGDSFSPAIMGSAPLLGTVGSSSNDVVGTIAPVEAAAAPGLTTATDTGSTLTHDVVGTIAPVEAAQSVLTTATDTVGTLTHDMVGTIAPIEAAAPPVLAGDVAQPVNVASDALASAAPVADTTEPVLASAGVSLSSAPTDLLQPAVPYTSTGQAPGPADTLLALATTTDTPIEVPGSATATPANVATDVSNAATAVDPTPIAGDVIALNDGPPPPANALFNGTHYTDYGVTLSSDVAVPPQHAVSPTNAASAQDASVPVVADVQQHAAPPPDLVDTTHPIDHLGPIL